MKYVNVKVLTGSDAGSVNGSTVDANQLWSGSFHFVSGSATTAGTVKVQASNDVPQAGNAAPIQNFVPTNWVDIPSATATITTGSQGLITVATMPYRWVRVVFTRSAGAGDTVICNMNALSA